MSGESVRHEVADVDEIKPGERMLVTLDGVSIGVFNVNEEFYALKNECCHDHGPVCTGEIYPLLEGEFSALGERVEQEFSEDRFTITCPWHGWEYDIETGVHIGDDSITLETFDVFTENGKVIVEL